jgi:predicted nucleic acid-binding protein
LTLRYAASEMSRMTDTRKNRVYVDSNVLIYAVEGVPAIAGPAKKLIGFLRARKGMMCTSEIALAEVLAPSKREGAWPLHAKRRVYLDFLIWSRTVSLLPVTRDILIRTADVRKSTKLKLLDAIHLISAVSHECTFLVSGDTDFKGMPPTITHVAPDENGVESLLRVLA